MTLMIKIGTIRKSQGCPSFCDKKGCFDRYEKCKILGKTRGIWVCHCKELEKISKQAIDVVNKSLNSL